MNRQQSVSQGDDVDDEARSSSTEDMSEGSRDSPTIEGEAPPARLLQVSVSHAFSGNPSGAKIRVLPDLPNDIPSSQPHIQNGSRRGGAMSLEDDKKREHKRRSKNWTRPEILKLIKMRTELDDQFRKSGKKSALWEEIAAALQKDKFFRDGQQCKDKWEKLMAGYKEVRDGAREKGDHPFFSELHALLSWKSYKKETDGCGDGDVKRVKFEDGNGPGVSNWNHVGVLNAVNHGIHRMDMRQVELNHHAVNSMEMKDARLSHGINIMDMNKAEKQETLSPGKRKREEVVSLLDAGVIKELLDTIMTRQQMFLKEMLDAVDRKEQVKEQMRNDREEKWRAEERAQRNAFSSAMIQLTHRLLGERPPTSMSMDIIPVRMVATTSNGIVCPKKRSKNWKKSEVSNLIRIRQEMENKFMMSTRRAGLWDELGEKLASLGIHRDGKQCREKWDKLMAEYKDVMDGRKDREESTHFAQLTSILGRSKEGDAKTSSEIKKDEFVADG